MSATSNDAFSRPAWLGIGAQRSGTTWFTDLLVQHSGVSLAGKKELHFFDRFLAEPWTPAVRRTYRAQFGQGAGEFTPAYLRFPWIARLVRQTCPDALVVVLLRDPVERFCSAMRWSSSFWAERRKADAAAWSRDAGTQALWGGMYAQQLLPWRRFENMLVLQYEAVLGDPQGAVDSVWTRLGLDSVPLSDTGERSRTSVADDDWHEPPGLRTNLTSVYKREVVRVARDWGINPLLWPNFS